MSLAAAGLKLWNSLPVYLKQAGMNFEQSEQWLTIFLFG